MPGQDSPTEIIVFVFKEAVDLLVQAQKNGEEAEDGSEVDKPVYKDKDMLVFKNHCFEVQARKGIFSRGGASHQQRLGRQLGVTKYQGAWGLGKGNLGTKGRKIKQKHSHKGPTF